MSTDRDIGKLASYARTALDDPGAFEVFENLAEERGRWLRARAAARQSEKADMSEWRDGLTLYAIDCLDAIIAVTDPVDDERETERCADSLDALGRAIERIREQFAGEHTHTRAHGQHHGRETASEHVTRALDHVDEAVAVLREIAEQEREEDSCEDCAVNGMDCRIHGEAARLAARAIAQSPEGVVLALRQAGLIDEPETERG